MVYGPNYLWKKYSLYLRIFAITYILKPILHGWSWLPKLSQTPTKSQLIMANLSKELIILNINTVSSLQCYKFLWTFEGLAKNTAAHYALVTTAKVTTRARIRELLFSTPLLQCSISFQSLMDSKIRRNKWR